MKNIKKSSLILSILSMLTLFTSANAEIKVVTSIKPIHSLASYLMDGIGKPGLIVDGYASPHSFTMIIVSVIMIMFIKNISFSKF